MAASSNASRCGIADISARLSAVRRGSIRSTVPPAPTFDRASQPPPRASQSPPRASQPPSRASQSIVADAQSNVGRGRRALAACPRMSPGGRRIAAARPAIVAGRGRTFLPCGSRVLPQCLSSLSFNCLSYRCAVERFCRTVESFYRRVERLYPVAERFCRMAGRLCFMARRLCLMARCLCLMVERLSGPSR